MQPAAWVLTPEGSDRYELAWTPAGLRADAPASNVGTNLRVLAWDGAAAPARDQEVCATWSSETDHSVQQGFALRLRRDGDRWRTITVTKNTTMAMYSNLNVHTWDTARTHPNEVVNNVHVEGVVVDWLVVRPLPWRACARALGNEVQVKLWPLADPEPSWDDPRYGGSVALPPGWDFEGHAGWFVGHLPPGGHAELTELSTRSLATT
jgi:hypothetical protein